MKKILIYIAIAAAAVSCSEMYGPAEVSTAVVNSEGIEITGISSTDNTITFTLAPNGEAAYYSYLVDQADAPQTLDAETLYSVGYSSVAQGTLKWTSENPSTTVTLEDLEPNTVYQIYAVAGSPTGVPGEVTVANVRTSDGVNPAPDSFSSEGNTVSVTFSENVTAGDGAVTAAYYAQNTAGFQESAVSAGTLTIPASDIVSDGSSTVTITVNGLPAGALYTVSLAEGAFKDSAGNPTPAVASGFRIGDTGEPEAFNINGEAATEAFGIEKIEDEIFLDPSAPFTTSFSSDYAVAGYGEGGGMVTFISSNKRTEIVLESGVDFGMLEDGTLAIFLPEAPDRGADVVFNIEEGAFVDIYGNPNTEWSDTLKYSYGYTMEDIVGTYQALGQSMVDGGVYYLSQDAESYVTIAEDDSEEGCNVSISGIFAQNSTIYGHFDFDSGILSIPDLQYLTDVMLQGQTVPVECYFANYSYEAPVEMSVVASGTIQSTVPWMLYIPDMSAYLDIYGVTQMTRLESAGTTSAAPLIQSHAASEIKAHIKGTANMR